MEFATAQDELDYLTGLLAGYQAQRADYQAKLDAATEGGERRRWFMALLGLDVPQQNLENQMADLQGQILYYTTNDPPPSPSSNG